MFLRRMKHHSLSIIAAFLAMTALLPGIASAAGIGGWLSSVAGGVGGSIIQVGVVTLVALFAGALDALGMSTIPNLIFSLPVDSKSDTFVYGIMSQTQWANVMVPLIYGSLAVAGTLAIIAMYGGIVETGSKGVHDPSAKVTLYGNFWRWLLGSIVLSAYFPIIHTLLKTNLDIVQGLGNTLPGLGNNLFQFTWSQAANNGISASLAEGAVTLVGTGMRLVLTMFYLMRTWTLWFFLVAGPMLGAATLFWDRTTGIAKVFWTEFVVTTFSQTIMALALVMYGMFHSNLTTVGTSSNAHSALMSLAFLIFLLPMTEIVRGFFGAKSGRAMMAASVMGAGALMGAMRILQSGSTAMAGNAANFAGNVAPHPATEMSTVGTDSGAFSAGTIDKFRGVGAVVGGVAGRLAGGALGMATGDNRGQLAALGHHLGSRSGAAVSGLAGGGGHMAGTLWGNYQGNLAGQKESARAKGEDVSLNHGQAFKDAMHQSAGVEDGWHGEGEAQRLVGYSHLGMLGRAVGGEKGEALLGGLGARMAGRNAPMDYSRDMSDTMKDRLSNMSKGDVLEIRTRADGRGLYHNGEMVGKDYRGDSRIPAGSYVSSRYEVAKPRDDGQLNKGESRLGDHVVREMGPSIEHPDFGHIPSNFEFSWGLR